MPPTFRRSYAMHGAIAAGGMATVHVGRLLGPGGFTRRVAIKRLHPQLSSNEEMAAMFAEEARLSARIIHANVVPVLDVVSADGELLLVMEYVHGESLSRLLLHARKDGRPLPVAIAAAVVADALHGLQAAHEATGEDGALLRLVHRDVSPQNILVGVDGVARVVDFGIAKAIALAPITRDGQLRGKIPYMAPEQLTRRAIDRRIDVYAAGVVLWEALAGRRLFEASDEPTLFSQVLEQVVPPPSRSNPSVGVELDAVVLHALERDPERRYPDARSFAMALEQAVGRASPLVVADWVKTAAAPALATRETRLAEMERAASAEASDASNEAVAAIRAPFASVFLQDGATRAVPASVPSAPAAMPIVAAERTPVPTRARRRGLVLTASAVAALLVAGVSASVVFARHVDPPVASGAIPAAALPSAAAAAANEVAVASPDPAPAVSAVASPDAPTPPPPSPVRPTAHGGPVSTRLCKVFDADKQIYVMRPMRVSRCP